MFLCLMSGVIEPLSIGKLGEQLLQGKDRDGSIAIIWLPDMAEESIFIRPPGKVSCCEVIPGDVTTVTIDWLGPWGQT